MKTKTIIALVIAVLMLTSIVSAATFASMSTTFYNKIAPKTIAPVEKADPAQTSTTTQKEEVIQTITNTGQNNPSSCTAQSDCPNGNCACKCAARPAAGGSKVLSSLTGRVTIPLSNLKISPNTASSGTLITTPARTAGQTCSANLPCATGLTCTAGKCVAQAAARTAGQTCSANIPCATGLACTAGKCVAQAAANTGSVAEADTTTVGECQSACLARCRAACTPSASATCTTNADCTSGYCRIVSSSAMPSITGTCVPCTLNNHCDTGKICSSGNCITTPSNALQSFGGRCTANAQCTSGRCSATAVAALAGTCLCRTNTDCGTGKTCNTATGKCAATLASNTGVSSVLRVNLPLTGKAITVSNLRLPANTVPSGTLITTPARTAGQTCSANLPCATGLTCTAGKCVAQTAARTAGQTCSANLPCATGLDCTSGFCEVPAAAGDTADSGTNALSNADTSVGSCQAACTETCRLECTPSAGTKRIGEVCSSPTGCTTECETGYGECSCESNVIVKKPEGESCNNNEECETRLECTGNWLFGKKCTKMEEVAVEEEEVIVEPLSPEVQTQVRTQLNALEPKLERMEQQVVVDGLVASREALIAMSGRPDCYATMDDVELKAECLKIRFETVTNLLESRGQITSEQATNWKSKVRSQAIGQERKIEAQVLPAPQTKTFGSRIMNLFGFTGSFWRVTGMGSADDSSEVSYVDDPSADTRRDVPRTPASYLTDLDTQYNALASLETTICAGYPTTLTSASVLKSCSTDAQCGTSGAVKCISGKCRVNKADVCTVGEFTGVPSTTATKTYGEACAANTECSTGLCRTVQGTTPTCACTANTQCPSGQRCAPPGICIRTTRKIYSETCITGAECESNLCVARAGTSTCACMTNAHCLVGQICTAERRCVTDIPASTEEGYGTVETPIPCTSDAGCSTGKACINNVCLTGKRLGEPCTNRLECATVHCLATIDESDPEEPFTRRNCALCENDAQCGIGRTCQTGVCQ